jgi:hypothetical protein
VVTAQHLVSVSSVVAIIKKNIYMYSIHSRRDRQFGGAFYQFHRLNMYALSTDRNTLFTGPRIQH